MAKIDKKLLKEIAKKVVKIQEKKTESQALVPVRKALAVKSAELDGLPVIRSYGQPMMRQNGGIVTNFFHRFKVRSELKTAFWDNELFEEQARGREMQRQEYIREILAPYQLESSLHSIQTQSQLEDAAVAQANQDTLEKKLKNKEQKKKNRLLDLEIKKNELELQQMIDNLKGDHGDEDRSAA